MFTIITTTFNCGSDLVATISSIKEQTYKNLQWIVLDGASTDSTLDLLQANIDLIGHFRSRLTMGFTLPGTRQFPTLKINGSFSWALVTPFSVSTLFPTSLHI